MKQLRIVHSGDWCLHLLLHTPSGVVLVRNEWMTFWTLTANIPPQCSALLVKTWWVCHVAGCWYCQSLIVNWLLCLLEMHVLISLEVIFLVSGLETSLWVGFVSGCIHLCRYGWEYRQRQAAAGLSHGPPQGNRRLSLIAHCTTLSCCSCVIFISSVVAIWWVNWNEKNVRLCSEEFWWKSLGYTCSPIWFCVAIELLCCRPDGLELTTDWVSWSVCRFWCFRRTLKTIPFTQY